MISFEDINVDDKFGSMICIIVFAGHTGAPVPLRTTISNSASSPGL
ncbi:hypothetical protein NZOSNM25_002042 [Nitrosopumilus zosterae]|nr:hypothetical protein [Nitrosopumilus zosterae]BDQ31900.1 hypothetical protein NZOSNM25_002042 [Nitrosopumilus zosterae]